MDRDTALTGIASVVIAIILLIIGRFFLFPAVCKSIPLQLPGYDFDFCLFFR
jgi:hypothetical protein